METATHTLITVRSEYVLSCQIEGKTRRTLGLYSDVTGKFCDFLGDKPLASVTQGGVRSYLVSMEGCSPVTVNIHFRVLRSFFNFLVRNEYIERSPLAGMKEPKTPKIFPYVLSEDEVAALLKAARPNQRDYAIIVFLLDSGVRASELVGLTLDDVNLATRSAKVYGKGQKERMVFLSKPATKALARWLSVRETDEYEDSLFLNRRGEALTSSGVLQLVKRLGKKAGLDNKRVSPHKIRHTFASMFIRSGGSPFVLQRMLGHSDIAMSLRYVHMTGDDVFQEHKKYSPMERMEKRRRGRC